MQQADEIKSLFLIRLSGRPFYLMHLWLAQSNPDGWVWWAPCRSRHQIPFSQWTLMQIWWVLLWWRRPVCTRSSRWLQLGFSDRFCCEVSHINSLVLQKRDLKYDLKDTSLGNYASNFNVISNHCLNTVYKLGSRYNIKYQLGLGDKLTHGNAIKKNYNWFNNCLGPWCNEIL